ncbi:protein E6-like [Arachis stenosperma]|uniref:protein E6-like n=1 Tax=Arachis stenosperma TaxID=217475 RepID=UPI0025AC0660|nr:protein E6-like [Arachis stenosperma]
MAPFSNFISCIFLTTLLLSLEIINARESQFFSKVTSVKETEQLPNKEFPLINNNNNNPQQEQPSFVPETTENSYGLYGHETFEHLPPTTTTTNYKPYNTEFEDTSKYSNNKYFYNHEFSNNNDQNEEFMNNNNNYYNKDSYGNYQNELSDTKYTEEGYNSMDNHKNYNNNAGSNGNNNNRYNPERQGMSDTRFLEGGKYYYDLESEKYNTNNHGEAYRGVVNNHNNNNNNDNFNNYNSYNNQGGNAYHGNYNSNQNNNQEFFEDEIDDTQP